MRWAGELYAEPHSILGAILYSQGKYEEGRTRYEKAMEIDHHSSEARFGLVEYHEYLHQYDQALAEVEKVVLEAKDQPLWLERAGNTCYSLGVEFDEKGKKKPNSLLKTEGLIYWAGVVGKIALHLCMLTCNMSQVRVTHPA